MEHAFVLHILQVICVVSFKDVCLNDFFDDIVNNPKLCCTKCPRIHKIVKKIGYLFYAFSRIRMFEKHCTIPIIICGDMDSIESNTISRFIWLHLFDIRRFKRQLCHSTALHMTPPEKVSHPSFRWGFEIAFKYFATILFRYIQIVENTVGKPRLRTLQNLCQAIIQPVSLRFMLHRPFSPPLIDIIASPSPIWWIDIPYIIELQDKGTQTPDWSDI